jgi:DeoR family suf operon transcriptional repressor
MLANKQQSRCILNSPLPTNDAPLLDLLRQRDQLTVADLAQALDVTATAIRQRLTRLMGQGLVERCAVKAGRGRPSHRYMLSEKGRRATGANFADLAIALWQEVRAIEDPEVRQGLLQRLARRMAEKYEQRVAGETLEQRIESLAELFAERNIPFQVDQRGSLPVLTALACPYPDLAQEDRTVCSMEKMLFSEILGEKIRLTNCRLDGESCCTFEVN